MSEHIWLWARTVRPAGSCTAVLPPELHEWLVNLAGKYRRIFLLPNFVTHSRSKSDESRVHARCTSGFIVSEILRALAEGAPANARIRWGNAPLQACDWTRLCEELNLTAIAESFSSDHRIHGPLDLRSLKVTRGGLGTLWNQRFAKSCQEIAVDLGSSSLLEPLFRQTRPPALGVGDYPPSATNAYHGAGRHIYILSKEVLEAELIVSVPKLKVHEKVGLSCALKGVVGTVARKECLPHYRLGGPAENGDEFPRAFVLAKTGSRLLCWADERGCGIVANGIRIVGKGCRWLARRLYRIPTGGGWKGNDTAWRMVLDLARLLRYARSDGTLSTTPVRDHVAIVDGLVAGEGEGPLRPSPRRMGVIVAGADACAVDYACALVAGWDPARLPLIANSFGCEPYRLTKLTPEAIKFFINGRPISGSELARQFRPPLKPPLGWAGVELDEGL